MSLDSSAVWLKILLLKVSKARLTTFGSLLPFGSCLLQQSWYFSLVQVSVCASDIDSVHRLLETFLNEHVLFRWDFHSLPHSYCFWVKAIYLYLSVSLTLLFFIYYWCVILFGNSGCGVFTVHASASSCVSVWDDGYVSALLVTALFMSLFLPVSASKEYSILLDHFLFPRHTLNSPWQLPYQLLVILIAFK